MRTLIYAGSSLGSVSVQFHHSVMRGGDRVCLLDSGYDILCCTNYYTITVSRAPSTSDWQCSRRIFLLASIATGKQAVETSDFQCHQVGL